MQITHNTLCFFELSEKGYSSSGNKCRIQKKWKTKLQESFGKTRKTLNAHLQQRNPFTHYYTINVWAKQREQNRMELTKIKHLKFIEK